MTTLVHAREHDARPEPGFPMPGDTLLGRGVIASIYYTDDIVLVLLLEDRPPFFTVGHYYLYDVAVEDGKGITKLAGSLDHLAHEFNIVPAVRAYEQNGGDY